MKGEKGLTLTELVVALTILSSVILVGSSILFTSLNLVNKGQITINTGNDLRKGYSEMKNNIKEADSICFQQAINFTNDLDKICNNPDNNPRIGNKETLFISKNKLSETENIYYEFKEGKLIEENDTTGQTKVLMENVEGSFSYTTKNLLSIQLVLKDDKKEETMSLEELNISLH